MKKLLFKIATVAAAAALTVGTLAGCGLFTVNQDRDMQQVVATVQIEGVQTAENIYKREMVAGYVSYGYQYVQHYGQTSSQAYTTILNNLINNKVIIQQSKKELVGNYKDLLPTVAENDEAAKELKNYLFVLATDAELEKYEGKTIAEKNEGLYAEYVGKEVTAESAPFRFVKPEKVYEAVSSTIDSINSLIESFADDDDDETTEFENISYSARTVPTMSEEEEEETEDDIQKKVEEYKKNYIKLGGTGAANFEKAIARLKEMGVVDSSEKNYSTKDADSILAVSYFRNMIKSAIESEIVKLYEDGLKKTASINYVTETDAARKDEVFNALWNRYVDLQRSQQATYEGNIKDFETQLGNVSDTTFVVYDSEVGYTYVSHLVVRFDEQQTELVSAEQKKADATDSSVQAYVDELVKEIAVKDLRATWVQSGYGTYDGESFTFSKDYVYDTEGPLATYNGNIKSVTTYVDKDENDNDQLHLQFHGVTPNEIGYDDFAALAGSVIGGENTVLSLGTVGKIAGYADDAKKINKTDFNKFEDLKFAFSDDEGNFNNYIGYLYSPITSSKKYVSAFTKACKEVSEAGVGAYQMFASKEYGLHVVLCTAKATYGVYDISDEGKAEFRRDLDEENKDSVAYLFMQANIDLVTDNYISDVAQGFIYSYTAEDSKQLAVTKYASVYSDLITE